MPFVASLAQSLSTRSASTSRPRPAGGKRLTTSAGSPLLDRARLLARRAVGLIEPDALAGGRLLERGDDPLVRLLRRGVGHEGHLAATPAAG